MPSNGSPTNKKWTESVGDRPAQPTLPQRREECHKIHDSLLEQHETAGDMAQSVIAMELHAHRKSPDAPPEYREQALAQDSMMRRIEERAAAAHQQYSELVRDLRTIRNGDPHHRR